MTTQTQSHPRSRRAGRPYRAADGATLNGPSPRERSRILASGNYSSIIPSAVEFEGADFLESDALKELGDGLTAQWPELQFLEGYTIRYLWKADGGKKGGNPTLGKCILSSGLVEFFGLATWVVWLAADWAREFEFTDEQVEATLYHELLHCTLQGKNDDEPAIRGHEFEGFAKEIERYGFWDQSMQIVRGAVQGRLSLNT